MATGNIPPATAPPPPPSSSGSGSPCAACKCQRRKCIPGCVFAPYFPPDQPNKFISVHKVFGASNVSKILNDLHPSQRADAVASLTYEAEYRLRDPVYGCVGLISMLQQSLKYLHGNLDSAKEELAVIHQALPAPFMAAQPVLNAPLLSNQMPQLVQEYIEQQQYVGAAGPSSVMGPPKMAPSELGLGLTPAGTQYSPAHALPREHIQLQEQMHQQQHQLQQPQLILEAAHQQLGSMAVREQELLRRLELQQLEQQQQHLQMMEGHHHHQFVGDGSTREQALLRGLELQQQLQQQHLQEQAEHDGYGGRYGSGHELMGMTQAGGEESDVGLGFNLLGNGGGDESVAEAQTSNLALGHQHHHHQEELIPSPATLDEEDLLHLEQQRRRHGKRPMCDEGESNSDGCSGGRIRMGFLRLHE